MAVMVVIIAITAVLLTAGTLIWWRLGDAWADAEHKRFKHDPTRRTGPGPTIIRNPPPPPSESSKPRT